MDEKQRKAQEVFETVCAALDARSWKYKRVDEDLVTLFSVTGDDISMPFIIRVDAKRALIRVSSPLPFKIPEDKRVECAMAVCGANYGLNDGSFDYDFSDGTVSFRLTATFRDSDIGQKLVHYMIECTCALVDKYNDKFLLFANGDIGFEKFFED